MPVLMSKDIKKIPVAERILLAEKLWESIPDDSEEVDISLTQKKEIERRLISLRNGTAKTVSWHQIAADLQKRRSKHDNS